uniref:hypothetical protein n=1 Tax=Streptomyces sp. DH12 TaxID=2857010 RepID=UPI001E35B65A
VTVEVAPDAEGGWDVRLRVRNFRFSPDGTGRRAEAGRGLAHLEVNGRRVAVLRTPEYHLAPGAFPRGTHQVTARLYADDGSVWAVDGKPVESTAVITVSGQEPTPELSVAPLAAGWRARAGVHQLFPLLVHAVLFGRGYAGQALAAARSALSL